MLSKKEELEIQERRDFWEGTYRSIQTRNFDYAKYEIGIYTNFLSRYFKDENYFFWLLRDVGWLRDELDSTQRGKERFEEKAKEVVTALNKLVLIIIIQLWKFPEEKRGLLLEKAYGVFRPIFTTVPKQEEGFAHFSRIEYDSQYHNEIYSRMVEIMREEYPQFTKLLYRFKNWKEKHDKEFAKKMGWINE